MDAEHRCAQIQRRRWTPQSLRQITTAVERRALRNKRSTASRPASPRQPRTTLAWGRTSAEALRQAASAMHDWLGAQLDLFRTRARLEGQRHRPAGQREVHDRHAVLRAARGGRRLGAVHLDRLRHDAAGADAPGEREERAASRIALLAQAYPRRPAAGRLGGSTSSSCPTAWRSKRSARASGSAAAGARRSALADRVRRSAERLSHRLGRAARSVAALVSRHAAQGRHDATNIVNLATALHREALALELHATPGWTSARFSRHRSVADEHGAVGTSGKRSTATSTNPNAEAAARAILRTASAQRWTPAPSCCGRRWKTCTR